MYRTFAHAGTRVTVLCHYIQDEDAADAAREAPRRSRNCRWLTGRCSVAAHVWIAWVALWFVTGFCSFGQAQDSEDGLSLHWQAPSECASAQRVRELIQQQIAAKPDAQLPITARMVVAQQPAADGDGRDYHVTIDVRTRSAASHRELDAPSCDAAVEAAVLMVGLALEPPEEGAPSPMEERRVGRFELGASAVFASSTLPGRAWGTTLDFGVAWNSLRFVASLGYFFPRVVSRDGASAEIDLLSAGVGVCYLFMRDPLATGGCGRFEFGRLAGSGMGVDEATPGSGRLQTWSISWLLRIRAVSTLWIASETALMWNQRRPQFTIDGVGTLHAPQPVGFRFILGPLIELE
jgi:hypothetical protein